MAQKIRERVDEAVPRIVVTAQVNIGEALNVRRVLVSTRLILALKPDGAYQTGLSLLDHEAQQFHLLRVISI